MVSLTTWNFGGATSFEVGWRSHLEKGKRHRSRAGERQQKAEEMKRPTAESKGLGPAVVVLGGLGTGEVPRSSSGRVVAEAGRPPKEVPTIARRPRSIGSRRETENSGSPQAGGCGPRLSSSTAADVRSSCRRETPEPLSSPKRRAVRYTLHIGRASDVGAPCADHVIEEDEGPDVR